MSEVSDPSGVQQDVATAAAPAGNEAPVIDPRIGNPNASYDGTAPLEKPKPGEKAPEAEKPKDATQPSEKDQRHFSQKIQQEFDAKVRLAKKLVSKDPESIYELAEEDESIANAILRDSPYEGAKNVEELRKVKEESLTDEEKKFLKRDKKLSRLEQKLLDEQVLRLRGTHPDLTGELESTYRQLYSDERFQGIAEDSDKLIGVARALTGKSPTTSIATDAALEFLKQQEGSMPSGSSVAPHTSKPKMSEASQRVMRGFGHSEADIAKYLPSNVDEILGA